MPIPAEQPRFDQPVVDARGFATQPWMNYWLRMASFLSQEDLTAVVEELQRRVAELEDGQSLGFQIIGDQSISVNGVPQPGNVVLITLQGDQQSPGNTQYYGTGPTGVKGWFPVSGSITVNSGELTKTVGTDGVVTLGLADVSNSGAGTLQAITVDSKGRVVGRRDATITGTTGRITVANGDASAGLPTIDLATVADSGAGTLLAITKDAYGRVTGSRPATITGTAQQIDVANGTAAAGVPTISLSNLPDSGVGAALVRITRDAKGRVSGTQAATTDNLPEGTTNLYFTTARAAAASPVQSVNGKTGVVVLVPSDIGAATAAQGAKADSALQSVVAGTGITVNNADPRNPIISATGGGGAVTSVNSRTGAVSVPDFASKAAAPTSSDFGRPIIDGDRWFNTTNGVDYTWVAGAWTYDNAAALSRYMPAYLSDGTASAVPLNADGTVPAYLSNGSYSPFATQA